MSEQQFLVYSPEGLCYQPPVTIDAAKALIDDRSTYAGEPGWSVVPLHLALDSEGYPLRAIEARRRLEQSGEVL